MPVTKELLTKISDYEKQGYSPDEIVNGLSESKNFPDIAEKAKAYLSNGYSTKEILEGMKSSPIAEQQSSIEQTTEGMNPAEKFLAGVGGSMYMQGKGLQQKAAQLQEGRPEGTPQFSPVDLLLKLISRGKPSEQITQEGMAARQDLQRLEQESGIAKAGSFTGDFVPGMAIPGGVGGKLLTRMATGALAGAGQGATRFTGEGESAVQNAAVGGTLGGLFPLTLAPVGKVINAVSGKLTKPINVGAKQSIPTTLGEDIGNPHIQRVETFMERIPFIGTMGFRRKQIQASEESAKDYLGRYIADKGSDKTRGMLESNRNYVSNIYENKVKPLIADVSSKYIPKDTITIANEISERYPSFWEKFGDQKVLNVIKSFQKGITEPRELIKEKTFNLIEKEFATGPENITVMSPRSFNDLWELRKGVGDMLGQAKQKLISGEVNKTQYDSLSKMYSAINSDMDNFANSIGKPEISSAMKTANDAYKNFVVKYNVLDRAMDKSMGQEVGGTLAGKTFSPQRFSSALNDILKKEKYNSLFTHAEKQEMAGLANILTTVKRAGQFMENPPTGNRMIDVAIGGGAIGSFLNPAAATVMGTTAGTTVLANFLTTTQAGKRLAMSASNIDPNSKVMKAIVDNATRGARSFMVNRATIGNIPELGK